MKFPQTTLLPILFGMAATLLDWCEHPAFAQQAAPPSESAPYTIDARGDGERNSRPPEATNLLQEAIDHLERVQSIKASTRQSVDLFGKQMVGSGSYLQLKTQRDLMFRLELRFQVADQLKTMLQVSDGSYLWLAEPATNAGLSRIDLRRVRQALKEQPEGASAAAPLRHWQSLGGLPGLLKGLQENFEFASLDEVQLAPQLVAYRIRGEWKKEKLTSLLPDQAEAINQGQPADLSRLPVQLPHSATVLLEKQWLLPRRIEYRRREQQGSGPQAVVQSRAIASIDFDEILLNSAIDPAYFTIGDQTSTDQTEGFLQRLGLKKQ